MQKSLEAKVKTEKEQLQNPFYVTLKAQKEEREQFMKLYSSGAIESNSLMPFVLTSERKLTEFDKIESTEPDPLQSAETR